MSVSANGLDEDHSWQFETSADKANNAFVRDMIERKKGGYYDSFKTTINNNYNYKTLIEGDQINCNVAPNAIGNTSSEAADSVTSSPTVSPGSNIKADATGNEADNDSDGSDTALNNKQKNSGNQYAKVSDLSAKAGDVDASGGHTSQVLNNKQKNSGDQKAVVSDSQGCAFNGTLN